MSNDVLLPILYAGLAGTLLALIVATASQKWSLRVFFLLALRLAIGWHFLFEGLHKLHSYYMGPSETNRVFSSEVYFKVSPGPLGPYMRKQFTDTDAFIATRVKAAQNIAPEAFAQLSIEKQAEACPEAVAKSLDEMLDKAGAAPARIQEAKAAYARWVYGVDGRDTKVKSISGDDARLTAPQRLAHLERLRTAVKAEEDRLAVNLGNGYGIDQKNAAGLRTDVTAAETDLVKDATAFVADLKKDLNGGKAVEHEKQESRGQIMDRVTMWFIAIVGACLMGGLLTRVACLAGTAFLVLTYLTHPPFPWFPLPPTTEGNPVFINKNVIEALALLAIATFPTGRWLGLDALLGRICPCGRNKTTTI